MSIQREIYWLDEKKKILQFLLDNNFEFEEQNKSAKLYKCLHKKEQKIDWIEFCDGISPEERNGFSGFLYSRREHFRFSQIRSNYFELMLNGAFELLSATTHNSNYCSNSCFSFIEDDFCTRTSFISSRNLYHQGINIYDKRDSKHKILLAQNNSFSKEEIRDALEDKIEVVFLDEIKPEDIFPRFVVKDKDFFRKEPISDVIERLK